MKLTFKYHPSVGGGRRLAMRFALMLSLIAVTGIAYSAPNITMPLVTGYFNDMNIYYVNTEASDIDVATADGTTYVPQLSSAIVVGATADIYVVTNFAQHNIVDSIPNPLGPDNADPDYSPLWRVTLVTWQPGVTPTKLTSEAAVLAARDADKVTLTTTNIVVNCAVVVTPRGQIPNAVAVNIEEGETNTSTITLPLTKGFVNGKTVFYINTEASDPGVAAADGTNYVPKLAATHASGAEADIFPFFGNTNPAQRNVVDSAPMPIGPGNTDPQYSPLWDVVPVQFVDQAQHDYPLVRSTAEIDKLEQLDLITVGPEPGVIVNCPVVRVPRYYTREY
jgi:hypothetical protein